MAIDPWSQPPPGSFVPESSVADIQRANATVVGSGNRDANRDIEAVCAECEAAAFRTDQAPFRWQSWSVSALRRTTPTLGLRYSDSGVLLQSQLLSQT